jgi:hypothetical protein
MHPGERRGKIETLPNTGYQAISGFAHILTVAFQPLQQNLFFGNNPDDQYYN